MPTAPIQYIVEVSNVTEVMLTGSADLAFWQDRLRPEDLRPYVNQGHAELLISATQLKWRGATSRELTVSVAVADQTDESRHAGFYLVRAFNSLAPFAWMERTFFKTPYFPGEIHVDARGPAAVDLRLKHEPVFTAKQSAIAAPISNADEMWAGPIYLPRYLVGASDPGRVFYAKLSGQTQVYPFAASDSLLLKPTVPVFNWLIESKFTARDWRLRTNATHAKSKTYRRS
ncbi:MAG: hypothetical protein U0559_12560 [Anaerolineae bacterium]